jgi:hypothetical protein
VEDSDAAPIISSPPFSSRRCAQLDATALTDYSGKSDNEPKGLIHERGIELRGRRKTAGYIKALEAPERQERRDNDDDDDDVEMGSWRMRD